MTLIETPLLSSPPAVHRAHIAALKEAAVKAALDKDDFDYSFLIERAEQALQRCEKWQ